MSYSGKIRDRVFELLAEGLSPEKIADRLTEDPTWNNGDIPTPRTIRNWRNEHSGIKESASLSNEAVMRHDREVFKKLDKIMNDKDFFEYFYLLDAGHSIHHDKLNKLAKYCYYAYLESLQPVNKYLKTLFNDFLRKLYLLDQHIGPHTFSDGLPDQVRVMPYVHREHMDEQVLSEFYEKFKESRDLAEKAYRKYRATIRDTLAI